MTADARCGACGDERARPVLDLRDADGNPARLVRCGACALVQMERPPSAEELRRYYARYCYESEESWQSSAATDAAIARVAERLAGYRSHGRLLDVGSGAGAYMRVMAARGWDVHSTELSDVAASRLRAAGFVVHLGELEALGLPAGYYDVVIMSELIEHVLEPRRLLETVFGLVRPGGALYLTTPNFGSLTRRLVGKRWRGIGVPEHLSCFERGSLSRLLAAYSYRVRDLWSDGINPYELWSARRNGAGQARADAAAKDATERLRLAAVRWPAVGMAKAAANLALRTLGLGDTLKALAERPPAAGAA
jgi:2-polyprenyl-3-methyl-5-hydroxy-6-metoxy-1,4-benzoquinol methylase